MGLVHWIYSWELSRYIIKKEYSKKSVYNKVGKKET